MLSMQMRILCMSGGGLYLIWCKARVPEHEVGERPREEAFRVQVAAATQCEWAVEEGRVTARDLKVRERERETGGGIDR